MVTNVAESKLKFKVEVDMIIFTFRQAMAVYLYHSLYCLSLLFPGLLVACRVWVLLNS
jgi:hypothetical protein